jgi:hypothetical protein
LAWSARSAFSIVSSTGPSSAALAFALDEINHPSQDRPLVRVEVAWRALSTEMNMLRGN